ncbi:recombinase family protein [Acidobacteria bacterium AH-259-G07]|nr:recombinase family protein [Acidobacteria bacterium AH-259-G07]
MNKKPNRVAVYARISKAMEQTNENQLLDLRRYVSDRDWPIYKEYCDGVTGTKDSRPALNQLMNDAKKRKFDVVLCWRFDRFARSTKHLILALEEFKNLGIDFVSFQENIDTSSPLGSAIFTIISAVAQLERDIIAERVKAGLRRARENGKKLGRPKVKVNLEQVKALYTHGYSIRAIAKKLGLRKSTAANLVKRATPES